MAARAHWFEGEEEGQLKKARDEMTEDQKPVEEKKT